MCDYGIMKDKVVFTGIILPYTKERHRLSTGNEQICNGMYDYDIMLNKSIMRKKIYKIYMDHTEEPQHNSEQQQSQSEYDTYNTDNNSGRENRDELEERESEDEETLFHDSVAPSPIREEHMSDEEDREQDIMMHEGPEDIEEDMEGMEDIERTGIK